jgi:hypothetical protein
MEGERVVLPIRRSLPLWFRLRHPLLWLHYRRFQRRLRQRLLWRL